MFTKGVPSKQIITKTASRSKDYEIEFANTDSNSDIYTARIFLRRYSQDDSVAYKIRLIIHCNTLAYPSLDMVWAFEDEQYELASKTFHRICNEVDDVKEDFDRSMAPATILATKIREAVKPISLSHQEKANILAIDENNKLVGVSDWRNSIYSGRYPNMSKEEKQKIKKFEGNDIEYTKRISYPTRGKY